MNTFCREVEVTRKRHADTCECSRPTGPFRVLRGGSWNNNSASNLLSAFRNNEHPTNRNYNNGFRLVLVVGSGGKATRLNNRRDTAWPPWLRRPWQE